MGFRQIQAPTLRELFVDQVIGMIFSGELKVGDRLPSERELSEQMHISRSMVHTGLEDLERMGFIRMEPRRGNYIEDYARHGNFETLMALAKYGGEIDRAIESSLVEARDAIEGGAMLLLGEHGTPGGYAAAACHHRPGCAHPSPRARASLPMRSGCASLTRPSPS